MSALLFGSISTVGDTSELQREAFNEAFKAHGLDWQWDRAQYREMLIGNGGQDRISEYARAQGVDVDAKAIHETKSKIAQDRLASTDLSARPGVVDAIRAAHDAGWQVAMVTTTSRANITAVLDALGDQLGAKPFDLLVSSDDVDEVKPDPAAYQFVLRSLGEQPGDCVAVEDNVGGVQSATAAGVTCVAFPNENTAGHDFGSARVIDLVTFDDLRSLVAS